MHWSHSTTARAAALGVLVLTVAFTLLSSISLDTGVASLVGRLTARHLTRTRARRQPDRRLARGIPSASNALEEGAMNTLSRHLRDRVRAFAGTIGPLEVAALARTVPTPETDVARILQTGTPTDARTLTP